MDLSPHLLPKYTFFSLCRAGVAYLFSLCFSVVIGYIAAKDRLGEKILVPCLDILQSIPVLGFMPALFLFFLFLFPHTNMGLELTSILMIFTGQTWNMAFCVYHGIRTIPKEKIECATFYHLNRWQQFRSLELPSCSIALVWNSMMGVAGGWFFLMTSEAFTLKNRDFRLPGLGSYMSLAASQGNIPKMLLSIASMILLIIVLDQFLWRPLVIWAQKFRLEETSSETPSHSWVTRLIKKSVLFKIRLPSISLLIKKPSCKILPSLIRLFLYSLCILLALSIFVLVKQISLIPATTWISLIKMTALTFSRVLGCLTISTLIAVPLGLAIGLSSKASSYLQPIVQIAASFPATLLFPALVWLFYITGVSMSLGTVILMLAGTGWYLLFTTLAGVGAIPSELKEVAKTFKLKQRQKLFSFYIPATAPYIITGMISAAGGAWNASIVAEYINYKKQVFTVPGIGSSISLAAQNGDTPLLIASIICLATFVALINYFVWIKLYHYSEKRFTLNI